ncbi:MAG: AAA family ATPase [Xanthomonadales bacterium]|nr:AAA family ATPase [Xanthomonadales bacterium]
MALPDSLHGLMDKEAYPHPCTGIELTETHISWVLLTGDFAYKLKKPVRFSFLDFSTLELREHFCREELRCNRSFAPQLYVDVVPVYQRADNTISMGGTPAPGDTLLEWAVQMHQFDPAAQLDRLLEQTGIKTNMLADFGCELAARHVALPRLTDAASEIKQRVFGPVQDNFSEIATTGLQPAYEMLLTQTHELADTLGQQLLPLIKDRMQDGYIRECHGDLHLSNLVLIDDVVIAFDCLEFNANLRWIDTINDVAFLFMDCHERGRYDLAYAFLNGYLDASGDYQGTEMLGYFATYRSMVRAKVAALRWEQDHSENAETRFITHIKWAKAWLERPAGTLLLMCGLSGAGKTYVADRLAPLLPAIRLRSDVARKTLAGLAALARTDSPVGEDLYHPEQSDEVYKYLARVAEALLCGGDNVIVDATFIEKKRRAEFLNLAKRLGIKVQVIYCTAPVDVLRSRIKARSALSHDASEATLEVLDMQLTKFEAPKAPEPVIELVTDATLSDADLMSLVDNK